MTQQQTKIHRIDDIKLVLDSILPTITQKPDMQELIKSIYMLGVHAGIRYTNDKLTMEHIQKDLLS